MARFKAKMKYLEPDWADHIWAAAAKRNRGTGASWLLPLAALAITGARPASLERGIEFAVRRDDRGRICIDATVQGAKLLKYADGTPKRGQREIRLTWYVEHSADRPTHRSQEFEMIARALLDAPGHRLTVQYDAEAISTRLRELSRELWPRRQHHVSAVCYRELFSAEGKAAGMDASELAAAMSHLSTESQGRYACARRHRGQVKPAKRIFSTVAASARVRIDRSPMNRLKRSSAMKAKIKRS